MIDRTRLSVRAVLVSALFLAVGAARSGPVVAAEDPMIHYHSPCHTALAEEQRASDRLKSRNATQDDARRTLAAVAAGIDWNNHACGTLAGRYPEDNAVRDQMYLVNNAFLLSLRGQAQTVLGTDATAAYTQANAQLQKCATSASKLPATVRANCKAQIAANNASAHPAAMAATDPCQVALQAANDAGAALKAKDYGSFEKAYARASAGLDANKSCTQHPQMRDLNAAYLLTWRTVADRYLDVPFSADPVIPPNAADPFAVPNGLFRQCQTPAAGFPAAVKTDCGTQLASNQRFLADYATQPTPASGQTMQPLSSTPIDWPYALRPDFVWDAPCHNNENARCADEEVRDGSGPNGWGPVPAGQATPLDGDKERVLFATIRNCDDLHRLFSGQPPQFTCDAFKSSILLVTAQHKPDQQCGMNIDGVSTISTAAGTNPPRDAVLLNYTLTCAPPVSGSAGSTVVKAVSIPRSNAHGEFANVTFNQSGGGGPRGAAR